MSKPYGYPGGRKAPAPDPDAAPDYGVHTPPGAPEAIDREPPKPRRGKRLRRLVSGDIVADAAEGHATLTRVGRRLRGDLAYLDELRDAPGSKGFEAPSTSSPLYCVDHERDLEDCKRIAKRAEQVCSCTGEPIPPVSDPTGTAMLADPVARDVRVLADVLGQVKALTAKAEKILQKYERRDRVTVRTAPGRPGCQSCARIKERFGDDPWWGDPLNDEPTTVHKRLDRAWRLCRACYDFVVAAEKHEGAGRLPTTAELVVRRDTGSWPKWTEKPGRKATA